MSFVFVFKLMVMEDVRGVRARPDVSIKLLSDTDLDLTEILHLLYIAKKYDVSWVASICRVDIQNSLRPDNILFVHEHLEKLDEEELKTESLEFIEWSVHFSSLICFSVLKSSSCFVLFSSICLFVLKTVIVVFQPSMTFDCFEHL